MDRPGPSGTQSRGVKCFLRERKLEQVIDEIYYCTRIGQILCGFEFPCIYVWLRHFA